MCFHLSFCPSDTQVSASESFFSWQMQPGGKKKEERSVFLYFLDKSACIKFFTNPEEERLHQSNCRKANLFKNKNKTKKK